MDLHPDFSDLLSEFARFGVRYALIGGYAVGLYAKPRATKDLDLLVSGEEGNLERVAHALRVGELSISLIALDDLIANKRATGRPQDLADASALERARENP